MSYHLRNIAIFLIAIFITPHIAMGESLGKKQCNALKLRKKTLARAGAVKNMARGPAWAKKKLNAKQLQDIKSLIGVSEQLLFRCGHKTMQHVNLHNKPVARKRPKAKKGNQVKKTTQPQQKKSQPAESKTQSQNHSANSLPPNELLSFVTQDPDKKKSRNKDLDAQNILDSIERQ